MLLVRLLAPDLNESCCLLRPNTFLVLARLGNSTLWYAKAASVGRLRLVYVKFCLRAKANLGHHCITLRPREESHIDLLSGRHLGVMRLNSISIKGVDSWREIAWSISSRVVAHVLSGSWPIWQDSDQWLSLGSNTRDLRTAALAWSFAGCFSSEVAALVLPCEVAKVTPMRNSAIHDLRYLLLANVVCLILFLLYLINFVVRVDGFVWAQNKVFRQIFARHCMRLVRSWGELHDFWLVSDVSLVAMMFRSAKSCIVLADFFLNFLLYHI